MRRIRCLSAGVFLILTLFRVEASSFLELSVSEVTQEARVAYRAQVLSVESLAQNEMPFRRIELQLLEVFKGRLPEDSTIFVEIPGGEVGELGLHISGLPQIQVGQEYVFFLDRDFGSEQSYRLSAWTAYQVVTDERGRRVVYKAPEEQERRDSERHAMGFAAVESLQVYEDFVDEIFWSQELQ